MHPSDLMRVTHVVHDLQGGGLESLVAAMARRFHGGATVLSVITLGGRAGRVGAGIRPLVDQFIVLRPLRGISMVFPLGLALAIRRTRPDIVHLHSGVWFKGAWAARLAGARRVVYTEHGLVDHGRFLVPWLSRRAAAMTDAIVTVSDPLSAQLESSFGVPKERCVTISNGIDLSRFGPGGLDGNLRKRFGIPAEALVVGSAGRLEAVKAYDDLVRSFARVAAVERRDPRPRFLLLCGDGSERDHLERLATELGVGDRVRFAGWVDDPLEAYRAMDVFALTSRREGVPLSLLEAMACQLIPVVTGVGSNASILGPELAGQVVPFGDGTALARVLDTALREAAVGSPVGRLARARVEAHYGIDAMLAAYLRVYSLPPSSPRRSATSPETQRFPSSE